MRNNLECNNCGQVFKKRELLKEHLEKIHNTKCLECKFCGKLFWGGWYAAQLEKHIMNVHEMDKIRDKYKCDICDKTWKSREAFRAHQNFGKY